jgi:hypothetical protein
LVDVDVVDGLVPVRLSDALPASHAHKRDRPKGAALRLQGDILLVPRVVLIAAE